MVLFENALAGEGAVEDFIETALPGVLMPFPGLVRGLGILFFRGPFYPEIGDGFFVSLSVFIEEVVYKLLLRGVREFCYVAAIIRLLIIRR